MYGLGERAVTELKDVRAMVSPNRQRNVVAVLKRLTAGLGVWGTVNRGRTKLLSRSGRIQCEIQTKLSRAPENVSFVSGPKTTFAPSATTGRHGLLAVQMLEGH